ncbi:MAG: acyl-CoA thioesterase [Alphaproteobacteria bacterium]|nr:acyl-CoA thioesterase [Alphaproteobacteria bacterium]
MITAPRKERRVAERKSDESPPKREPTLRTIAMPSDANIRGDIFGGWILAQMDLAGGSAAMRRARGRVATVGIASMSFHQPVFVGDEVSTYTEVEKVGRSSITIKIEVWARRFAAEETVKVTEGVFTYVAIDADRKPRPVPPI